MTQPMKRAGFAQGIYEQSDSQKESLGTLRVLQNGTKWRYCKAGTGALAVGKLVIAAEVHANVKNQACASAHAIGDTQITETITAGVAFAENFFAGGSFQINDGTNMGYSYPIVSSTAVGTSGTSITITLGRPLATTLTASTSKFSLIHNSCQGVVHPAAKTGKGHVVGITARAVTAGYYFWVNTGGLSMNLITGTPHPGTALMPGTGAGNLVEVNAASKWAIVAKVWGTQAANNHYNPVEILID